MDYDSVNYNIEETNTELANYGSWSFVTVEGHSSNVVIRLNNNNTKTDLDGSGDDRDGSSLIQSTSSLSTFSLQHGETEPTSLLEVIDDKNKEIVQLKRMNYNQKLQLNYYLKKSLVNDTVATLGRTININIPEEYDAINFSMARFNKANNRKSRIIRAYEKLNSIESKIAHLLKKQESLLRKVTLDVLSSTAERSMQVNANNSNDKDRDNKNDGEFISYVSQLDVFSKLLATTLSVKRELEIIKTYSRRIIIIEEERNSLVDYIYQLPVEQRLNGSYLLSVEREKAKLCMEMANIRNDQKMLKEKISQLNHEEEFLKETVKELKSKSILPEVQPPVNDLHKVLKMLETEAISLVTMTKEERNKLLDEVQDLRNENQHLQDKIKQNLQTYMEYESKLIDAESKCTSLESKVETLTHQKHDQENELLNLNKLQTDIKELLLTNEALKKKLSEQRILEAEVCELKQKLKIMEAIKEERDKLRVQVEEYHSLQVAIETCPKLDNATMESPDYFKEVCNKVCKIKDLENERELMKNQCEKLAGALIQQDDQIKNLLNIFERFGDYKLNKKPERNKDKTSVNDMYFINLARKIADKFNNSRIRDILLDKNLGNLHLDNITMDGNRMKNNVIEKYETGRNVFERIVRGNSEPKKHQDIKELISDCSQVPAIARPCSSNEVLQSVFGPNRGDHTTKIIETGELLSKLNCHIETLEETTRGFCSKNVMKSNTSISVRSSILSIKDSDMDSRDMVTIPEKSNMSCHANNRTDSRVNIGDMPFQYDDANSTSKSKLPVRASSVPPVLKKFGSVKEDFIITPNKKSKLLTRVSSNDPIKPDNLYSLHPSSANRKLKDLCSNADGECNTPVLCHKNDERKKSAPEAGDDLSKSISISNLTADHANQNNEFTITHLKNIEENQIDEVKKLNSLHLNIQVNSNKDKVIGDLKEIQYQLETLNNSDNTEDLRNNFKKFYNKIFGESIEK